MPTEQELVALFGDDFNEILLGLQQLPPEVRELLENTMGKMIYDADVFANRINKTAQTQAAAGIAGTATQGMLATDMLTGGRVFGELRNSIKESLVEGINQTGQAGSFQAYDPDEETLFVWVTVAGHKICADCAPRGGEQRKLREWENEGMPGTGWSVCGGHCYCILDPSGKISPRIKMEEREKRLKIQEKGATIRPKELTPKRPTPKAPQGWKPKMTSEEALSWSKNSSIQGELYHGSSAKAIDKIGKDGFDFQMKAVGKLYGNGAYTTKTTNVAAGFAPEVGGKTGVFIANTKNSLSIKRADYWSFQTGLVDDAKYLTRGHDFIEKAKAGLIDLKALKKEFDSLPKGSLILDQKTGKTITFDGYKKLRLARIKKDNYRHFVKDPELTWHGSFYERSPNFHNQLTGEWFDFIEDQYLMGNENAIDAMRVLYDRAGDMSDLPMQSDGWANLLQEFITNKGYDSLIIRDAHVGSYGAMTDDFYIILDMMALTMIETRVDKFIEP